MKYKMRLRRQPFEQIRSGVKTIELRLYDEKRQQLRTGDEIEFSCIDAEHGDSPEDSHLPGTAESPADIIEGKKETITVRVTALHIYNNFRELYTSLPLLKCGYTRETVADARPEDMDLYYSAQEQACCKVVGIEFKLISPQGNRSDELTRISRFISLVLRHKPQEAGLSLDSHGWANVSELLRGVSRRYPLTMKLLEEIVRSDEKQRYSFNSDKTKIRANQGHSIPVDVEPQECEPPELLYHGTGRQFLRNILSKGLLHQSRLYVHLSPDIETAKMVGIRHGSPVVLIVQSGRMYQDGFRFYLADNGVWLTEHVPAKYLRVLY